MHTPLTPETLALLRNPYRPEDLRLKQEDTPMLVGAESGRVFPIIAGIPSFLENIETSQRNRYYRRFYDRFAFAYDAVVRLGSRLKIGTETRVRAEAIATLPVNPGDKVLETALGTGSNVQVLPSDIDYFGVDISLNMLRRAQRNLARWGRSAALFHADAEHLPFKDSVFDRVFQMGGLQFMGDPAKALAELARVAKPGTTITILDEIASAAATLRRVSTIMERPWDQVSALAALPAIVPAGTHDAQAELLPSGEFYRLRFSK
jgi:ubiquinone/menaquinone biosynthesis C-methylase UbiE